MAERQTGTVISILQGIEAKLDAFVTWSEQEKAQRDLRTASWPGLARPSTSSDVAGFVDGRAKPGHDGWQV